MRRALVIFLILLFPLNVLALTTSVVQRGHAPERIDMQATAGDAADPADLTAALDCETSCDIDPEEPPSTGDYHSIPNPALCLQVATLSGTAVSSPDAVRRCRTIPPPVKPPRTA